MHRSLSLDLLGCTRALVPEEQSHMKVDSRGSRVAGRGEE